jgi:prevent-host-death family protein
MCTDVYTFSIRAERRSPMTTIPTESLKFTEARPKLSSILDRVFQRQSRVRLYKGKTPIAAIVSIDDLERLESLDRERDAAFARMAKIGEGFLDVSDEELEMRINETTARVRQELWAERQAAAKS